MPLSTMSLRRTTSPLFSLVDVEPAAELALVTVAFTPLDPPPDAATTATAAASLLASVSTSTSASASASTSNRPSPKIATTPSGLCAAGPASPLAEPVEVFAAVRPS